MRNDSLDRSKHMIGFAFAAIATASVALAIIGGANAASLPSAAGSDAIAQTAPVPPQGTFSPSPPTYGSLGLALAVYSGGTINDLQNAAAAAGASGVWVQDRTGVFQLLVVEGPAFVTGGFAAAFPSAGAGVANFPGAIAVTLVQAATPTTRTVALSDNGATLTMHVGDRFVLMLGESYNWNVQVADQSVVSRVVNIATIRGSQGVYQARSAGETDLTATGDPACRQSTPACAIASLLFRVHLIVTP